MNKLIIIQGATASGKSSLALSLAKELKIPIVSADSRQFYKELSIGTAKPSDEELLAAEHYFVNTHSIHELTLTSAGFMKSARNKIDHLFSKGHKQIIITGGSGMFIDALIDGLHPSPSDSKVRSELDEKWRQDGIDALSQELKELDLETYNNIDLRNPMRILRSLEIIRVSGKTIKEIREEPKEAIEVPFKRFSISWKREDLYTKINIRVEKMIEDGLFDEVKKLPIDNNLLLQNTVGYKEWIPYFSKEYSYEDTIALIQKNSRNYAKRQETWLKRYKDLICLNPYDRLSLKEQLLTHL
jgi:tRNA dimethylallyltransferase